MDKKVLDLLKALQSDIKDIKNSENRIEKKLDAVVEQTVALTEFRTETREGLKNISDNVRQLNEQFEQVEKVTMRNTYDIVYLKSVK